MKKSLDVEAIELVHFADHKMKGWRVRVDAHKKGVGYHYNFVISRNCDGGISLAISLNLASTFFVFFHFWPNFNKLGGGGGFFFYNFLKSRN